MSSQLPSCQRPDLAQGRCCLGTSTRLLLSSLSLLITHRGILGLLLTGICRVRKPHLGRSPCRPGLHEAFTAQAEPQLDVTVRKLGRTQASSPVGMMGVQESGTLTLGQGSGQRLGLFISPKGLYGPCPTLSFVGRAISGEACCAC